MDVSFGREADLLLVTASGAWDEAAIKTTIEEIPKQLAGTDITSVLIDMSQVSAPSEDMDRYRIGIHAAEHWGADIAVAAVWSPDAITRFAEDTAVNRGVRTRVFVTTDAAREWLDTQRPPGDE